MRSNPGDFVVRVGVAGRGIWGIGEDAVTWRMALGWERILLYWYV
jgi:hypothetical protein